MTQEDVSPGDWLAAAHIPRFFSESLHDSGGCLPPPCMWWPNLHICRFVLLWEEVYKVCTESCSNYVMLNYVMLSYDLIR